MIKTLSRKNKYKKQALFALLLTNSLAVLADAQESQRYGITPQGATGGLVIPSAFVLGSGDMALSESNYQEPTLGIFSKRRDYNFGIGILPNIELFGRVAEYQNPLPGTAFVNGIRDLSANVKGQLPQYWNWQPKVALGLNDLGGGAKNFSSKYIVLSDQYGPLRWTGGYAKSQGSNAAPLSGIFGGVEVLAGGTGLAGLAEYDGQQRHIGVRYYAPSIPMLANAQIIGTLQKSSGAKNLPGQNVNGTNFNISVLFPLGKNAEQFNDQEITAQLSPLNLPSPSGMVATREDHLENIKKMLIKAGLERVRVGAAGRDLVVEYENHRYGQNEADAIGIVLGVGAELAPANSRRIYVVTLKAGQRVYENSVGIDEYRSFLRSGDLSQVRTSLTTDRSTTFDNEHIAWEDNKSSDFSRAIFELKPDVKYHIANDLGLFDYALAGNFQAIAPLWRGAEFYSSYIQPLSNSINYNDAHFFKGERQLAGLRTASLQQAFWISDHFYSNVGIGKFLYSAWGAQVESTYFIPGSDDVIRLKGARYQGIVNPTQPERTLLAGSYRWVYSPKTWFEVGVQQFSDGTRGPTLDFTKWYGDIAVQLYYRRGGTHQYAGLQIEIPLTPRKGMDPSVFQVTGTSQFSTGVRTLVRSQTNDVILNSVQNFVPEYNAEMRQFNQGRNSQHYFTEQLMRMRQAFLTFGIPS